MTKLTTPCVIFSKKSAPAQQKYTLIKQELLAIILAFQHFEIYVLAYGPRVTVFSDHSPLQLLAKIKLKNFRLTHCRLLLQQDILEVRIIKGNGNVVAEFITGHCLVSLL